MMFLLNVTRSQEKTPQQLNKLLQISTINPSYEINILALQQYESSYPRSRTMNMD